jgi:maleylpyruvate isomerase
MSQTLEQARAALRQRQGGGARYDAADAPAQALDWARRGTAYFARLLNELSDADLDAPSALPDLTRRHVIAHIGYQARMLSEIVAWARTGQRGRFPRTAQVSGEDVAHGATLPARALRYLFHHSEVHLNVEWRDLSDADWPASVEDAAGRQILLWKTPEARAKALWLHAVDLASGGRPADMPPGFVDALIRAHAPEGLGASGHVLAPTDRPEQAAMGSAYKARITGRAADIAFWLCGRGMRGVQATGGPLPPVAAVPPGLIDF